MSAAIQQAAISYFGLPEGTQLVEGGPMGCFAFVVPLTEEHLRGIADRMKALSEPVEAPVMVIDKPFVWLAHADTTSWQREQAMLAQNGQFAVAWSDLMDNQKLGRIPTMQSGWASSTRTREELRSEYDSMAAAEKARFGSFGQYCAHAVMGTAQDDALMHGGVA